MMQICSALDWTCCRTDIGPDALAFDAARSLVMFLCFAICLNVSRRSLSSASCSGRVMASGESTSADP